MDDLIKRSDAIRAIKKCGMTIDGGYDSTDVICALEELPSADKQGHWVVTKVYREGKTPEIAVRCSECKRIPLWLGSPILPTNSGNLDYCPHCGMEMKGADDEID